MHYDIDAVRWVIENYVVLSSGNWPDPKTEEKLGKVSKSHRAVFEDPVITAAEVCIRVRQCGMDGLLVQLYSGMLGERPRTLEDISKGFHIDYDYVTRRINDVVWYCSDGEYRNNIPYRDWKRLTHGYSKYRAK